MQIARYRSLDITLSLLRTDTNRDAHLQFAQAPYKSVIVGFGLY